MSVNMAMNIQMNMNQKKNANNPHRNEPNDQNPTISDLLGSIECRPARPARMFGG
jgi:hypothetical protein